jgi:hypothetical protein
MSGSAIKLSLYDAETNEERATFTQAFVPWRMLKAAVRLSKRLNKNLDDLTEEDIDALSELVVEVFGQRFTVDELNDGADLTEMLTVLTAIISRAKGLTPENPPQPPG